MTKHFSFILSFLGIFLVSLLVLKVFNNDISFEFDKTFLVRTSTVGVKVDPKFLSYFTGVEPNKKQEQAQSGSEVQTSTGAVIGIAFGDTHFTRGFQHYLKTKEKKESDYFTCFESGFLKQFDIASVNLETSVAEASECQTSKKSITFRTEPSYIDTFKSIGITHFNIANNHSYDCGKIGYTATKNHLKGKGVVFFGEGRGEESVVATQTIKGINIAFIGLTDIETRLNLKEKAKLVKTWSDKGYKVIVNMHFGVEYQAKHSSYQELIAHTLVDNGASLIIGHHPHTVEDSETYKNVPIYYSLGNFIFDQPFDNTLDGLALVYELTPTGVGKVKTITFKRDAKYYNITDCTPFSNFVF